MIRGTTPNLIFTLPFGVETIVEGYITFKQRGAVLIDKKITDDGVVAKGDTIEVFLTQAETLKMTPADKLKMQLRLRLADGNAVASQVMESSVGDILKDGEI